MEFKDRNGVPLKVGDKVRRIVRIVVFQKRIKGVNVIIVGTRGTGIIVEGSEILWDPFNFEKVVDYYKGARYGV